MAELSMKEIFSQYLDAEDEAREPRNELLSQPLCPKLPADAHDDRWVKTTDVDLYQLTATRCYEYDSNRKRGRVRRRLGRRSGP